MRRVEAVVAAAGLSSRFGANKLLAEVGGKPVVAHVVDVLVSCGLGVTIVTGRDPDMVARACPRARAVFNPRFSEGLGGSIAAGVSSLDVYEGVLIALGDMPGLRADVVHLLLATFEAGEPGSIVVPAYEGEGGRHGHPVLFSSVYRAELESLSGGEGAKGVVHAHRPSLVMVPVLGRLRDVDLPEDLDLLP